MVNVKSLWKLNIGQRFIFGFGVSANLILAAIKLKSNSLSVGDVILLQQLMN